MRRAAARLDGDLVPVRRMGRGAQARFESGAPLPNRSESRTVATALLDNAGHLSALGKKTKLKEACPGVAKGVLAASLGAASGAGGVPAGHVLRKRAKRAPL